MERHKKEKKHRKKPPRVPIKTYRWEDIRRSRLKGGYPWTYLYKEPFDEDIDPKVFIMESTRKSKSSSTLQASSEGVDIKEVTNGVEEHGQFHEHLTPEPSGYIVITEVPSDSENHSKNVTKGSITIEDVEEPETLNLESAESSDNISQYLDKEEAAAESTQAPEKTSTPKTEEAESSQNGRQERAKSEEPKRKRKLSIDSSYSRKSLSKLGIIKKLKEAKDKIKTTKITLPNLPIPEHLKPESSKKSQKEEEKKSKPKDIMSYVQPSWKNETPVYIHIPLKPPEGQTDEFSYLEFGDKKPEPEPEPPKPEEPEKSTEKKPEDSSVARPSSLFNDNQRRYSEHPDDIVAIEIVKAQSIDLPTPSKNDMYLLQPGDGATGSDIMVYLPGTDDESKLQRSETRLSVKIPSRQNSKRGRAKSAEPERKRKLSIESSHSRRSLSKVGLLKKLKNAKEKLKLPTFSLSRSNSKKEERKKPAKEEESVPEVKKETKKDEPRGSTPKYIHIPLKPPPGQTDEFSYLEFEEKEEPKEVKAPESESTEKKEESSVETPTTPKKEGVQFIVLTPPSDDEILDHPDIPETPSSDNKKFFEGRIGELKEIARDAVDEVSPKSRRKKLDLVIEEDGSEKAKPKETKKESQKEAEEAMTEAETKKEETENKPETMEKMVVDEEDGLKLTESAMAKQEQNIKAKEVKEPSQELKSSLKVDGSPVLKKKVSFKRKSKDDSKDGIYEDIQAPADDKAKPTDKPTDDHKGTLAAMGNSQSMSTEEEKSYLDEQKIIKTTSLEEDYNRWSKLSDHEYEPVNPPPDDNVVGSKHTSPVPPEPAPTVHVIDTSQAPQQKPVSVASSTTSLDRRMLGGEPEPAAPEESFTVQELQSQIEDKYFRKTPEPQPTPQTTVHTVHTTQSESSESKKPPSKSEGPGRIQQAIKAQTGKLKTKLHGIKKPNIKLPSKPKITKPNLQKFKFEKPHINLPKIPDKAKISLPTFSLPRKNPLKRSLKQRQLSTESNAGDSKTNYFDFRTYPRLFKKKQKNDFDSSFSSRSEREVPEFATVPRTKRNKDENDRWGGRDTIRIPLHAEDSVEDNEREDSVERRMASHMRYDQDIDIDDAYERENQEIHTASPFSRDYNSRWNHGSFHPDPQQVTESSKNRQVTDLDSPEDVPAPESFDTNNSKDVHSSESSLGIHRRGVLEEIDSDEFFLRQKGISQDNIEVGMYLSSEIREAFKSPSNALADLQREPRDFSYDPRASNQSLPETPSKRKVMKKPKRKKTPHVSQEQITYDQDSEQEFIELPPARPKRRSKRNKKPKEDESVIPYQETIAVEHAEDNLDTANEQYKGMYENEQMEGKEQPEIKVTDPYAGFQYEEKYDSDEEAPPEAPPRKQRSLKSLNYSEHDSILGEFNLDREPLPLDNQVYRVEHEYIIPTPDIPPSKPPRTLSRSSSKSRENEEIQQEVKEEITETPMRPTRTRSRSRTRSRADSLTNEEPCVEEPCVQDFRDSMGYAVIDKNVKREPPLPPPRTPPRRKRSVQSTKSERSERRFFTVPRPLKDEPPMRPLRNYSTLGPCRPPRRKPTVNMTDEEKENIDITQYIEIDDEPNRDLHSGEVIQKMRDRPLPAPPRPPRKTRALQDITSQENIAISSEDIPIDDVDKEEPLEEEVFTQTEPFPDDFVCEEVIREEEVAAETSPTVETRLITSAEAPAEPQTQEGVTVEKRLITPTHFTYEEETITHGSLVVEPLNGAKILPDSEISRRETPTERSIPVTKDYDDETSEIPEEFAKLKDPVPVTQSSPPQPSVIERIIERPVVIQPDSSSEVEVLRAQKLQVSDLDVDRLSVNELLASKIIVSEIDSGSIQTAEISSKSGALKVGEIELPPSVVQQLFEKLQSAVQEQQSSGPIESTPVTDTSPKKEDGEDPGQKKTPFEEVTVETLPQRPPRKTEETNVPPVIRIDDRIEETETVDIGPSQTDSLNILETEEMEETQETKEPPAPPVRSDSVGKQPETHPVVEEVIEEVRQEPEQVPQRPPRHAEKVKEEQKAESTDVLVSTEELVIQEETKTKEPAVPEKESRFDEPEIDDEPPPRPPEPQVTYVPSQPPPSFYALRAQQFVDDLEGDIPMAPRRRRHHHKPPVSRSSSDDSPVPPPSRRRYRSPEPSIPQLTGQLIQACGSAANSSIKRLIAHITNNILRNADGQQDLHVMMVILLVLIAGLILLGYGDGKTVHYHHWEYFNPPRDM